MDVVVVDVFVVDVFVVKILVVDIFTVVVFIVIVFVLAWVPHLGGKGLQPEVYSPYSLIFLNCPIT